MWQQLKAWAKRLKADIKALALALGDARVPFLAKLVASITVAYALSPIDLIPDFIPILGYLDDLLLLPLGIWLSIKLIPPPLLEEFRQRVAQEGSLPLGKNRIAAAVIIFLWLVAAWWAGQWAWHLYQHS
ncbi:YkvA family protein [Rufibacter soli]